MQRPMDMSPEPPYEETQPTQPASQGTSELSASQQVVANSHLWGALLPTNPVLMRIDFWRGQGIYSVGRHPSCDIVLRSPKISNVHCTIQWKGQEENGEPAEVVVTDLSTNGTFINGVKLGRNRISLLEQGNELAFGALQENQPHDDHRYMYRHFGNIDPNAEPQGASELFDKYQLSVELGRGAFASVRRAIGVHDGDTYAVKIIQQRRFGPTQSVMFHREMEIIKSLDHPGIVHCFDVFHDPSTIFIVMEFVDGGDLLELVLKSDGGLAEPEAQGLTRDIVSAMAYLHASGIVHRDLKPENVLVTSPSHISPRRRAKIADFGLAKIMNAETFLKTACGTPAYLAPEVVLGYPGGEDAMAGVGERMGKYNQRVDSWSVGVMVYTMLTMSMPFDDGDAEGNPSNGNDEDGAGANAREPDALRQRMASRTINWAGLRYTSHEAQSWLRQMLQEDPRVRMGMSEALVHPWLADPYGEDMPAVGGSFYYAPAPDGHGGSGQSNGNGNGNGNFGGFGGQRNGNTNGGGATYGNGNGNGATFGNGNGFGNQMPLGQRSSDFIYGTDSKMSIEDTNDNGHDGTVACAPSTSTIKREHVLDVDVEQENKPLAPKVDDFPSMMSLDGSPVKLRKRPGAGRKAAHAMDVSMALDSAPASPSKKERGKPYSALATGRRAVRV